MEQPGDVIVGATQCGRPVNMFVGAGLVSARYHGRRGGIPPPGDAQEEERRAETDEMHPPHEITERVIFLFDYFNSCEKQKKRGFTPRYVDTSETDANKGSSSSDPDEVPE